MSKVATLQIIGERGYEVSVDKKTSEAPFGELVKESILKLRGELPSAFGQSFPPGFNEIWRTTSSVLLSYWGQRLNGLSEAKFKKLLSGKEVRLNDQRLQITRLKFNTKDFFPCYELSCVRDLESDTIYFQGERGMVAPGHVDLAMKGYMMRPGEKYYSQQQYDCRFEKGLISRAEVKDFLQKSKMNHLLDDIEVPAGAFVENALDLSWLFPRSDIDMVRLVVSTFSSQSR